MLIELIKHKWKSLKKRLWNLFKALCSTNWEIENALRVINSVNGTFRQCIECMYTKTSRLDKGCTCAMLPI